MSKIELPPMPQSEMLGQNAHRVGIYGHTQEAMQADRRAVVEACAQAVEALDCAWHCNIGSEVAAAIRSLLEPAEKETSHGA